MFTIRSAGRGDEAGAARVVKAVYDEYGFTWDEEGYHADLFDLKEHYIDRGHRFWVAEQDGEIVGCAALERFKAIPGEGPVCEFLGYIRATGSDCALQRLYVDPEARRSGVGTALFELTIDTARRDGRKLMEIWSDKRFDKAHRLYRRAGAVDVGERICDDPDVSPEWGLVLPL